MIGAALDFDRVTYRASPLPGVTPGARARFGYDATEPKNRRQAPTGLNRSEDRELPGAKRAQLLSASRDLRRNFAIAAWMIRRHLDYVSTFTFQAKTGDGGLDDEIESLMAWWSKAPNCDVSGRHDLARMIRLAEAGRTVDGDLFLVKLADGRIQPIEGDRVRTVQLPPELNIDAATLVQGVRVDASGRPLGYVVCNRQRDGSGFEFNRLLPASYVLHHACWDRFDQTRGVSPLAPAINALRDVYEGCDYALAKAKVAQMFGLVLFRDATDALGAVTQETDDGSAEKYQIDFGKGPLFLDLAPGDKAEFLESNSPSGEFQSFCEVMIGMALKALDIPYSFYDEAHTNYSGARQALLQYEQAADVKRRDLLQVLDALTAWRLRLFVQDGDLRLPRKFSFARLKWAWNPTGLPWIDPLKEVTADVAAISAGLASRQEVCLSRGSNFFDVADRLAEEEAYLREKGLSLALQLPTVPADQPVEQPVGRRKSA